jgi:glutathione S-transferase
LKENLLIFEKHFKLKNYLVGYKLTLADVYLVAVLIAPYQLLLDKKMRDQTLPNLTRFLTLNLKIAHFQKSFGVLTFCSK